MGGGFGGGPIIIGLSTARSSALVVTIPSGFSFKKDIFSYLYPLKRFKTQVSLEIHLISHWLLPSTDILFVFGVNLRV